MNRWTIRTITLVAFAAAAAMSWGAPAREAAAGGGACHAAPIEREASGDLVKLTKNCFAPTVLRVELGTAVTFLNDDPGPHHISGVANEWGIDYGRNLNPGESQVFTFSSPGTYAYSCYIHLGMSGVIVVGDGKYGVETVSVRAAAASARPAEAAAEAGSPAPQPASLAATEPAGGGAFGGEDILAAALGALAGGLAVAGALKVNSLRRG